VPRRLGQHFLTRSSILESIAAAVCPEPGGTVIEIGPGRGALTSHLLARASRVVAIEIDPVLVQYLQAKFRDEPKLEIVEGDILKADMSRWTPAAVAGNLPYYITSPILERVLSLSGQWPRAVFLVQKEVAERLAASPGSRDYGFLSVQTQFYAEVELLMTVPPAAFRPPPKVDSAVVRLTPRDQVRSNARAFLGFASQCFRHKRKTLRNNLLGRYDKELLDSVKETSLRAEQLSIAELASLQEVLDSRSAIVSVQ
jgi:16S rRNA (adenine1518-N6/adenine1519-N6)-dimethyltransferase